MASSRASSSSSTTLFTIGHSTRDAEEFLALLNENDIDQIVDVRKIAGSNRFPQFNADTLAHTLAARDIAFHRIEALTGRRLVSKTIPFEVNAWWQNRSFHNYADHALSDEFRDAIAELRDIAARKRIAIMCSEAVWWRCHRRIIADHLLCAGGTVQHILGPGHVTTAELSAGAIHHPDGRVTYPPRADEPE